MKLDEFLADVLSKAPHAHLHLQQFLDKQVNTYFAVSSCLKDKHWKKAFNSIMSTEQAFCTPEGQCLVNEEKGWKALRYLILHFRTVLEAYITAKRARNIELSALLQAELQQAFKLIVLDPQYMDRSEQTKIKQLQLAIAKLNGNDTLRYRSGYDGHSIYFNFTRKGSGILVTINNLGGGSQYHTSHPNLKKQIYQKMAFFDFSAQGQQQLQKFTANLVKAKALDEKQALPLIYAKNYPWVSSQNESRYGLAEVEQDTGNCVVKNNLLAAREFCGSDDKYQELYHVIKNVTLSNQQRHYPATELPANDSLCHAVQTSQATFTLEACSAILDKTLIPTQDVGNGDIAAGVALGALGGLMAGLIINAFSKEEKQEKKLATIAGLTLFGGVAGAGAGSFAKHSKEANNDNFSIRTLNNRGSHLLRP